MNMAVFFQKNYTGIFAILKRVYVKFFLHSNKKIIKYLRDCGAQIGENVFSSNLPSLLSSLLTAYDI